MQVGVQRAGAAKADNVLYIVEMEQLIAVNADGGDTHAVAHNGNRHAMVGAGVAQHPAHSIKAYRAFQVVFGGKLGAQRVAGHQYIGGYLALLGSIMGCRHKQFLLCVLVFSLFALYHIRPRQSRVFCRFAQKVRPQPLRSLLEYDRIRKNRGREYFMNTMVIGIAGGTGSGKTTVTEKLQEYFGADVSVLHHDSYYKRHDELPFEKRRLLNYDHPDSFDTSLLIEDLRSLKAGHTVHCPVYDYSIHNRTDRTEEVHPTKVIIVEGILIFADEELASEMDIKIFVDTDADERILRRILRDVRERGRTLESVVEQYLTTVKPMHEQYVEPSKRRADIIMLQGGHNLVALDMLIERIRSHIGQEI